jgi:hypothetical protein
MASLSDFTQEERKLLRTTPDAASMAVIAANPDGAVKEREAYLQAWDQLDEQPFADGQAVLALIRNRDPLGEEARFQASDTETLSSLSPEQSKAQAISMCQQAMALLKRKASVEEATNYRQLVLYLCRIVAAQKTGGFLGIGAERITSSEQAVLDDIAAALQ